MALANGKGPNEHARKLGRGPLRGCHMLRGTCDQQCAHQDSNEKWHGDNWTAK
jgi:hypothetical protein